MMKLFCSLLLLFFVCNFALAKEYYFRLSTGQIVIISTDDNVTLSEAIHSGDFESSFGNSLNGGTIIETQQADGDSLLNEILSLHTNSLTFQANSLEGNNVIELINICDSPIPSETSYPYKCAIPICMRRFISGATGGSSQRSAHHKTHFEPDFLKSLNGQIVICPFCNKQIDGLFRVIMLHFSKYCSIEK